MTEEVGINASTREIMSKPQRLKIESLGDGQHPSMPFAFITDAKGNRVAFEVHTSNVTDLSVSIGYIVGVGVDCVLIELPQEALDGTTRVWVRPDQLIAEEQTNA